MCPDERSCCGIQPKAVSGVIHPPILKRLPDAQLTDIGIVCVAHQKGVQFLLWQGQLFHKVEAAHQQLFHLIFTGITLLAGRLKVCDLSIYKWLMDLYERQGRRDKLIAELEYHVFVLASGGMEMLNRLKKACTPAQWVKYRERYLSGRTYHKLELMESEGLWERLMEAAVKSENLFILDRYEAALKKRLGEIPLDKCSPDNDAVKPLRSAAPPS